MIGVEVVLPSSVAFLLFGAYIVAVLTSLGACIRELRRGDDDD